MVHTRLLLLLLLCVFLPAGLVACALAILYCVCSAHALIIHDRGGGGGFEGAQMTDWHLVPALATFTLCVRARVWVFYSIRDLPGNGAEAVKEEDRLFSL